MAILVKELEKYRRLYQVNADYLQELINSFKDGFKFGDPKKAYVEKELDETYQKCRSYNEYLVIHSSPSNIKQLAADLDILFQNYISGKCALGMYCPKKAQNWKTPDFLNFVPLFDNLQINRIDDITAIQDFKSFLRQWTTRCSTC